MNARYATGLLCALDLGILVGVRPRPCELLHRLHAPRAWLEQSPDAALATAAGTLLWLVAAWFGIGIAVTMLGRLPGVVGSSCAALSGRLLPSAVRRLVAGSVGLGVLLAPLPVVLGTTTPAGARPLSSATALPSPVWPEADAAPRRDPPTNDAAPAEEVEAARHPVVVRPGDCLWLIAARRLGPHASPADVAAAWPRWYAANRDRIGDDPQLIKPGQRLVPPDTDLLP